MSPFCACGVQILSFATGMLDYVIVARLNIKAGISDKAFVLGDEVRHSLPITLH